VFDDVRQTRESLKKFFEAIVRMTAYAGASERTI
jgi:hypothetical protein